MAALAGRLFRYIYVVPFPLGSGKLSSYVKTPVFCNIPNFISVYCTPVMASNSSTKFTLHSRLTQVQSKYQYCAVNLSIAVHKFTGQSRILCRVEAIHHQLLDNINAKIISVMFTGGCFGRLHFNILHRA